MGFWSSLGGALKTVTKWVKEAAAPIATVVKKVGSWMKDIGHVTEAHLEGKNIVLDDTTNNKTKKESIDYGRPDFSGDAFDEEKQTLLIKIEESKSAIQKIDKQSVERYNKLQLQIEVVELIIASQTFNRFASNIQLHESNLRIHHQTIQNSAGLLDAVNRQRVGIKALMTQMNRVIRSLDTAGINSTGCEQIKNIDVDPRPGAISIANAYKSFEEARQLLENEASEYITMVDQQISRALKIKSLAESVPDKKNPVSNWIDRRILPGLKQSKLSTEDLLMSISTIPVIEAEEQEELTVIVQSSQDQIGGDD
jgi:hypothetical protein